MTKEQLKLAMALIASLDDEGKANAEVYGNWADHLSDQISDQIIEDMQQTVRAIKPQLLGRSGTLSTPN
tara:strand:+ start:249 stop:455 length:207 start_codon:yes stop_codon:yes gene_type:complete